MIRPILETIRDHVASTEISSAARDLPTSRASWRLPGAVCLKRVALRMNSVTCASWQQERPKETHGMRTGLFSVMHAGISARQNSISCTNVRERTAVKE